MSFIRRTLERVQAAAREIVLRIIKAKVCLLRSRRCGLGTFFSLLSTTTAGLASVVWTCFTIPLLSMFELLFAVQGTAVPKAGQEAVLSWLAAVAGANSPRVMGGEVAYPLYLVQQTA